MMIKQLLTVVAVMCVAEQDHEVQEDKIVLVSLLMAELGVHSVAYAFPKVKIITTAVDKSLDDLLHVIPGIGKQFHTFIQPLCNCSVNLVSRFVEIWTFFPDLSLSAWERTIWIIVDVQKLELNDNSFSAY